MHGYLLSYFTLTKEYHAAPCPHKNGKHPFDGILEDLFGGSNEIKLVSMVFDGAAKDPFKFEVGSFPGIGKNMKL
ncbi:MAG: hypothetical protein V1918_06075, partial [Planctomycetota bacterium]